MKYYIENSYLRMEYLRQQFSKNELLNSFDEAKKGDVIVYSPSKRLNVNELSATKATVIGGLLNSELPSKYGLDYFSFSSDEIFVRENSELTAEATLAIIISATKSRLNELNILICGGGNLAKALTKLLVCLGVRATFFTFNQDESSEITKLGASEVSFNVGLSFFDVIINTIPLDGYLISRAAEFRKNCVILELASVRSLADGDAYTYLPCPALPLKYSPKSAALAMKNCLDRRKQ